MNQYGSAGGASLIERKTNLFEMQGLNEYLKETNGEFKFSDSKIEKKYNDYLISENPKFRFLFQEAILIYFLYKYALNTIFWNKILMILDTVF